MYVISIFMKKSPGFTLIELLVVITIIGILATITIPAVTGALDKAKLTAASAQAGGIVKLCALIQVDELGSGDTNLSSWPGLVGDNNIKQWYNSLTNYSGTNDLMKLFSAGDVKANGWAANTGPSYAGTNAYWIYGVSTDSSGDTVLMTTHNWKMPATGTGPALSGVPFNEKGAILVKKGGTAQVVTVRQATNDVGSLGSATNGTF